MLVCPKEFFNIYINMNNRIWEQQQQHQKKKKFEVIIKADYCQLL